jgi:hypothetical protein
MLVTFLAQIGDAHRFYPLIFYLWNRLVEMISTRHASTQGQVFHPIRKVLGLTRQGDYFQILDALSNGDSELMGIDNASKRFAAFLAL